MSSQSPRPRAADDFAAIHARLEELRREREQVTVKDEAPAASGPRSHAASSMGVPGRGKLAMAVRTRRLCLGIM